MDEKEEIWTTLEDLDKVETKNRDLRDNTDQVNECIKNLKEQLKKFKDRHRETSKELKKVKEEITSLRILVEKKKGLEDCLNTIIKSNYSV